MVLNRQPKIKKTVTGGFFLFLALAMMFCLRVSEARADIGLWLPLAVPGELDLMEDQELSNIDAEGMVDYSLWESGGSNNWGIIRFAWDIHIEGYAEIDSAKVGHYNRTVQEMGRLGSVTVIDATNAADMLAVNYPDYRDRADGDSDDRAVRVTETTEYHGIATGSGGLFNNNDQGMSSAGNATIYNFGLPTGPAWTQWDLNLENIRLGNDRAGRYSGTARAHDGEMLLLGGWEPTGSGPNAPFTMDGLIFRAEFRYYGTANQRLQRIVVGSNKVSGDVHAEIKVLTGWLTTEAINTLNVPARITRDNFINRANTVWSNTIVLGPIDTASFKGNKPQGAFVALDIEGPNMGWNALGGQNEYGKSPGNLWPFYYPKTGEQPDRNWRSGQWPAE